MMTSILDAAITGVHSVHIVHTRRWEICVNLDAVRRCEQDHSSKAHHRFMTFNLKGSRVVTLANSCAIRMIS